MRESYLTSLAVGLRVQSDLGDRSVSLARMLHELVRQPQSITRQQYLEDRDAASERSSHWGWANKGFDELADEGGDHLDPRIPGADLEELLEHVAPIRKIVNTTIAHASPRARNFRSDLRPESLSVALELVLGLFKKYSSHLANVDVAEEWTLPAWWTIFREPWKEA